MVGSVEIAHVDHCDSAHQRSIQTFNDAHPAHPMRLAQFGSPARAVFACVGAIFASGGCTMSLGDIGDIDLDICASPNPAVASVGVQPKQVNLRVGFNAPIQALPLDAQGALVFCAPEMTWSSSDPSVATVSQGTVVAVSAGKAFIRATSGGKSDSAEVTVVATAIASVEITGVPPSLLVGQTSGLQLVARDADGNVVPPLSIVWQTDDAAVATVSARGMVIAMKEGSATVSATAEGLKAVARVTVTADLPVKRFSQIAAGGAHTCAIVGGGGIADGTAFCWGEGTVGQLGGGVTGFARVPTLVSGGHTFTSIAVGDYSSCALTASGETYCWGSNDQGQLGDGTRINRMVPVRVSTTVAFRTLASGGTMTCGLTPAGTAYCWGLAGSAIALAPALVPGSIQFADLTGGRGYVCGRTSAGRVYCWGSVFTWAARTPTAVRGDMLFAQISAGASHACGVALADGLGYCWGRMDTYPLGSAIPQGVRETPVAIPGGLRYASVAAGSTFTCGVTTSGSYCFGTALLSNSSLDSSPRAIPKDDRLRFVTLSAGASHACAIDPNGGGWCWGGNSVGQVGAGDVNSGVGEPLQLRIP
jgi:alpha-tubulin suppressor-like RCC1 family protein